MTALAAIFAAIVAFISTTINHMPFRHQPLKWGAYTGWTVKDLPKFEALAGKPVNYQATFVHWGNENSFPMELAKPLKDSGKTLVIFWEAMDYNEPTPNQPDYNYDKILTGRYDNYIKSFATSVANYGGSVILVPFEEVNGDWYPWSGYQNGNTPQKHIQAFRYLHTFFDPIKNVQFAWNINSIPATDAQVNQLEDYYPGDQFVDVIGVNGFNFDKPTQSWSQIFDEALTRLQKYPKPIIIMSTATGESDQKAEWITQGLGKDIKNYPQVIGWIWFNENKEKDWRIDSSPTSLSAFKSVLP